MGVVPVHELAGVEYAKGSRDSHLTHELALAHALLLGLVLGVAAEKGEDDVAWG